MATLKQIQERIVSIIPSGHGHWKVTYKKRGENITVTTYNSVAIDRIKSDADPLKKEGWGTTLKQAYLEILK